MEDLLRTMQVFAARFPMERFDSAIPSLRRPPVFLAEYAEYNLILPPDEAAAAAVVNALPAAARHRWFTSMRSSQALTQSVFAGLAAAGQVHLLGDVMAECGRPAFAHGIEDWSMNLEKQVSWVAEPRPTSVDVWFEQPHYAIAVECKLTEVEFGRCSRPTLAHDHPSYCNGSYTRQLERTQRCALTEIGVEYWSYLPQILDWHADQDHSPCPLDWTYQLVRNILAATVHPDHTVHDRAGHAVIVYDLRNPAFAANGDARLVFNTVSAALREKQALRIVSWQAILSHLAHTPQLSWLTDNLAAKYGLTPDRPPLNADATSAAPTPRPANLQTQDLSQSSSDRS